MKVPNRRSTSEGLIVITPLKWWGSAALRLEFRITKVFPQLKGLEPFKSVFFSRWSILTSFHYNGTPQVKESPPQPYMLWEVAYSAEVDPYIESFIRGIGVQIRRLWRSSYGFPGTDSVSDLRTYIESLAWPVGHAYWAYPTASVRIVLSALEVAKEHAFLVEAARRAERSGKPEQFARTYAGFLRRRGEDL
jgi:hypothetical protein